MDIAAYPEHLQPAVAAVRELIRRLGSVAVGLSGGVDSAVVLAMAADELGSEKVLAVTAVGPMHPPEEADLARAIAEYLGVELVELDTAELDDPRVLNNALDRCYWCKHWIFSRLGHVAEQRGLAAVLSGSQADDENLDRPGRKAERELGVARPLLQAGVGKETVRQIARARGLSNWDRPARPCLATRLGQGRSLDPEVLARVARAERSLHEMGFAGCRLRDHYDIARIELAGQDIAGAIEQRDEIVKAVTACGYRYITLDLAGYSST
jgi:pyridinium-3,5-biscarboxylic acid mononucleotide sulfurtransferase